MNKIAIDGYPLCFKENGIHRYLDSIISNLNNPDQKVYLFIPNHLNIEHNYPENIIIIKCGPKILNKYLIWSQIVLPFNLFKNNINILWSPTHRVPFLTLISKIKNIITIHDLVSIFYPNTMKTYSVLMDIIFLRLCSLFKVKYISVSEKTKDDFCKIYNVNRKDVKVINLASSLSEKLINFPNIKFKNKFILCVGTIEPRKNHVNLLNAYSKLNKDIRDEFKLIIIGAQGWGNINLESKISELNLNSDVQIYHNITDSELAYFYKSAYLSIYPSFYEGCGLPILESNGLGTPTIVSNVEPMRSLCPSSTIEFDPFDTDSIANAIYLAVTDVGLYNSLKSNTYQEIKKYSWKKSASQLYKTLIN